MRNKITIEFDSIDLSEARTFYNIIINYSKNKSKKYLITRIQTKLDCNMNIYRDYKVIFCSICNVRFKRIYTPTKPKAILYQHDCKLYENIYQQKKIINIEVI